MKIGIDGRAAKWYRGTGIGTYSYQLIKSLSKIDQFNNYLIFLPKENNTNLNLKDNFQTADISTEDTGDFWGEVNIPNILSDKKMDIYHVPQNGVGLSFENNCPSIITLHDVIPCRMPETVGERYLKIFCENMKKIIGYSSGIITVSNFSKMDIIKEYNYPKERIQVTPLAAEPIYRPINKIHCKNIINKEYSIKEKFILYVGGFSPRKNISGLIEAFSIISNKHDVNLVIAGAKGKSYNDYLDLTYKLKVNDKVIFPGFIPTNILPFLYNAAEIFVYPSFYEGFGLPPVEAMACGIPVISSNVTSIPEIVGDAAITINPLDINELSTAMDLLLSDNCYRQSLGSFGIKRSSEFSWDSTARDTLSFYGKISANTY